MREELLEFEIDGITLKAKLDKPDQECEKYPL